MKIYFSAPSLVGIDIQANEVRLVKLKRKKQAFFVEWAVAITMPDHITKDGKIYRWDHLAAMLNHLVKKRALNEVAAIAIPVNLVKMQTMSLPLGLSDIEIKNEIEAYVYQDLPGLRETLCIDFISTVQPNIGYLDISFVAVKREMLSQYVSCVNTAGLRTKIVDVDIYALNRAVSWLLPVTVVQADYLVLYISAQQAMLLAVHQTAIIFHQAWIFTGYEDFFIQLQRNMRFYLSSYPKRQAKKLVICAQYIDIDQVVSYLQTLCLFEFYYPNIFHHFSFLNADEITTLSSRPFDFLVALGLAMREVPRW